MGDVLQAQGKLGEAQAAFGENLAISRRLAEADPSNAGWQRELAVELVRFSRIESAPGQRQQRLSRLREARTIFDQLIDPSPDKVDWRRELEIVAAELRAVESLTSRASP